MLARGAAVWDAAGRPTRLAGSQTDITDRKVRDPLTGLPNRALFLDRLDHARARARRAGQGRFAVLYIDLDRFKMINDSLGHSAGDQLLVQVSRRIEACLRGGDTVARLGGDEFTVLLEEIRTSDEALEITQRVHEALLHPFMVAGHELYVTASVGISLGDRMAEDLTGLLRDADTAMYRAKVTGRGRSQLFSGEMRSEVMARLQIENDLRRGFERQEFEVHYQPIVSLADHALDGFEALVRWRHPERGLLLPAFFIGVAEETGVILPLGMWVLEEACAQLARWRAQDPGWEPLTMSVNLSPRLFAQPDLVRQVAAALERSDVPASRLKLEITEGLLIEDPEQARSMIQDLRAMGVSICLDDFGTGYSSLSYLNRFAVDVLKIDRSFIRDLTSDGDKAELVKNILRLAADLQLTVIAEGVETPEQRRRLEQLDCLWMQGFEFSRPVPAEDAWRIFHPGAG
jgi:diguanylate cyclase (GGDEF)-like protein